MTEDIIRRCQSCGGLGWREGGEGRREGEVREDIWRGERGEEGRGRREGWGGEGGKAEKKRGQRRERREA